MNFIAINAREKLLSILNNKEISDSKFFTEIQLLLTNTVVIGAFLENDITIISSYLDAETDLMYSAWHHLHASKEDLLREASIAVGEL